MNARREAILSATGRWLFVATLLGSVLALGSLDTVVLSVVVVALAASCALLWWNAESSASRRVASLILATSVALTIYTALQSIPLPASFIRSIAPHNADVWSRALSAIGEPGPAWHPLSLDPIATRVEVLRGVSYALALLCALRVARHREGVTFLTRALVVGGTLVAFAALAHPALGLDKVWGVYKPKTDVGAIAPLLNSNHLAGYVNIAVMLAFGSALSSRPFAPRAVVGALALLLAAMEVWLASRGGVASMVLGIAIVLVLRFVGGRGSPVKQSWIVGGLCVLAGVGMFILGAFEGSLTGLKDTDVSKLSVNVTCFRDMVPAYPIFGAGRGAFESTFPEFRSGVGFVVFSHAENLLSQWTTEWGAPFAAVAMGVLVYALRPRFARARGDSSIGAWVAIVVLAVHNLVDFSMEVPGVMLALVVCAGIVCAGKADPAQTPKPVDNWSSYPRVIVIAGVVVAAAAIFVATQGRAHELLEERLTLQRVAADANVSDSEFRARISAAMLAHPAEAYFPYLGGARALRSKESPMPWMERTLERAPVYGPAHLVLARWLRRRSPSQARFEYRLASTQGASFSPLEAIALIGTFDDAKELTPEGADGIGTLETIARALADSLPATRWRVDQELLARGAASDPTVLALPRLAQDALADLVDAEGAPWCADGSCSKIALAAADRAEASNPTSSIGFMVRARVSAMQGDPAGGLEHLRQACETKVERAPCLVSLVQLAIDLHHDAEATRAIDDLSRSACKDDDACVSLLLTAASLEDSRSNTSRALVFLRHATQISPDRFDVLEAVAAHASHLGLHADALDAYQKLARLNPSRPDYAASADRERISVTLPH